MFKYELESFWKPFMGEIDITIELDEDNGETPTGVVEARYRMDAHGNGHICLLPGSVLTRQTGTHDALKKLINFIEKHEVGDEACCDNNNEVNVWRSLEFGDLIRKAKEVL